MDTTVKTRSPALRDPWVTPPQAARIVGVSRPTVAAMVARGELVGEVIAGRLVVLRESAEQAARLRVAA